MLKITKGNNSTKHVGARHLVMLYISTKFCEIISNGIKVMEGTRMINHARMDRRMDGQMERRMDGQTLKSSEGIT